MNKFRAFKLGTTEWVYGSHAVIIGSDYIVLDDAELQDNPVGEAVIYGFVEVIPETVGQCAEKLDWEDRSIYAGDKLSVDVDSEGIMVSGVVEWDNKHLTWIIRYDCGDFDYLGEKEDVHLCVIGTIHDARSGQEGSDED